MPSGSRTQTHTHAHSAGATGGLATKYNAGMDAVLADYMDEYLTTLEHLPHEVCRSLMELRKKELEYQTLCRRTSTVQTTLTELYRRNTRTTSLLAPSNAWTQQERNCVERVRRDYQDATLLADQKMVVAGESVKLLEFHLRKLDEGLKHLGVDFGETETVDTSALDVENVEVVAATTTTRGRRKRDVRAAFGAEATNPTPLRRSTWSFKDTGPETQSSATLTRSVTESVASAAEADAAAAAIAAAAMASAAATSLSSPLQFSAPTALSTPQTAAQTARKILFRNHARQSTSGPSLSSPASSFLHSHLTSPSTPYNFHTTPSSYFSSPSSRRRPPPPRTPSLSPSLSPSSPAPSDSDPDADAIYCFCRQGSFGNMVACDNPFCPYEWFHYECVGLTRPPVGTWYCGRCIRAMEWRDPPTSTRGSRY